MSRILITGATGGIGSKIVEALAQEGVEFFLQYLNEEKRKEKEEEFKKLFSNQVTFLKADLTDEAETNKMTDKILEAGGADIIVHSVSLPLSRKELIEKDWNDFEKNIILQAKSLFLMTKRLVPIMKQKKEGRIISIVSEAAVGKPPVGLSDYVVAKYALFGLSNCLASEYGRFNIRCNSISPGFIETDLTKDFPARFKELAKGTTAEEVAALVKSLCFEDKFVNGENILLNAARK